METFQNFLKDLIEIDRGGNHGHVPYHVGNKTIVHTKSTSKNIIDYTCPWLCYFHGVYYLKEFINYKNKKFPYFDSKCNKCIIANRTYENWIKMCKEKSTKTNIKHFVWNIYKGFLAADHVNKVYYFTKDKTDMNLIFHLQLNSELLEKYQEKTNDSLVWYVL